MKGSQLKLFYKIMLIFLNRIKKKKNIIYFIFNIFGNILMENYCDLELFNLSYSRN